MIFYFLGLFSLRDLLPLGAIRDLLLFGSFRFLGTFGFFSYCRQLGLKGLQSCYNKAPIILCLISISTSITNIQSFLKIYIAIL